MKTNSYVKAVMLAMKQAEKLGIEWYVNEWRGFMVTRPRITLHREI